MSGERKKKVEDKKAVISSYSQIRFDVWDSWAHFAHANSSLKGLDFLGKFNTKEYRQTFAVAVTHAFEFYSKVKENFPEAMVKLDKSDSSRIRVGLGMPSVGDLSEDDRKKFYEYLSKFGTLRDRYFVMMRDWSVGVSDGKGGFKRYQPTSIDLSLCLEFMQLFIYESGIGDIEGRFQGEEENMFRYG